MDHQQLLIEFEYVPIFVVPVNSASYLLSKTEGQNAISQRLVGETCSKCILHDRCYLVRISMVYFNGTLLKYLEYECIIV